MPVLKNEQKSFYKILEIVIYQKLTNKNQRNNIILAKKKQSQK